MEWETNYSSYNNNTPDDMQSETTPPPTSPLPNQHKHTNGRNHYKRRQHFTIIKTHKQDKTFVNEIVCTTLLGDVSVECMWTDCIEYSDCLWYSIKTVRDAATNFLWLTSIR